MFICAIPLHRCHSHFERFGFNNIVIKANPRWQWTRKPLEYQEPACTILNVARHIRSTHAGSFIHFIYDPLGVEHPIYAARSTFSNVKSCLLVRSHHLIFEKECYTSIWSPVKRRISNVVRPYSFSVWYQSICPILHFLRHMYVILMIWPLSLDTAVYVMSNIYNNYCIIQNPFYLSF